MHRVLHQSVVTGTLRGAWRKGTQAEGAIDGILPMSGFRLFEFVGPMIAESAEKVKQKIRLPDMMWASVEASKATATATVRPT